MSNDLAFLSQLWLREPNDSLLKTAVDEFGFPAASASELAAAYSDLFLLNVYPYASVFLEPTGEMNGARARAATALYEQKGYAPAALREVGAADHIGLLLGAAEHAGMERVLPYVMDWAPVLCLAIERAPNTHPFYQALATRTRQELVRARARANHHAASPLTSSAAPQFLVTDEPELSTHVIVRHLLTPAQSGIFLTRARLGIWARALGAPLAFGERFQVGLALVESAGVAQRVETLLNWLRAEVWAWDNTYLHWAHRFEWDHADLWRARTAQTFRLLDEMKQTLTLELHEAQPPEQARVHP